MKISELETKIILSLRNEPIHIGGAAVGDARLSLSKAGLMAKNIIQILKKAARKEYCTYFLEMED